MSRKKHKEKADKSTTEDDGVKNTGQTPNEKMPALTFDEYQCSGNVVVDFPLLCGLLDMKNIPAVSAEQPVAFSPHTEPAETVESAKDSEYQLKAAPLWSEPRLQVKLENEDPLSAKTVRVSGWKVDEQIAKVLQKTILSLSNLQSLQFWQAGLTDQIMISFKDTISLCSNLKAVTLEGNPLPAQSYHLLLSEDSTLTHLSLRNNRMGDEGARLIGSALSTPKSANKNLLSLNLAFNSIGDAGATYIAQGLRLNRALRCLSLSNNRIGDSGAAHFAEILGNFALTHDEVEERRKLLQERMQTPSLGVDSDQSPTGQLTNSSSSVGKGEGKGKKQEASKRDEKATAKKENLKSNRKALDTKVPQNKVSKQDDKEKQLPAKKTEAVDVANCLLDPSVQSSDGEVIMPGNTTLTSLNLAGNRITEKSLPLFLTSLKMQDEAGGLLRLCLQRNHFPPDCEIYVKIKEVMTLRDPLKENISEETGVEGQEEKC